MEDVRKAVSRMTQSERIKVALPVQGGNVSLSNHTVFTQGNPVGW
jgi:phosphoribosylformylglycinamidine (FGAM) synthase-like enzyme